MAVIHEGEWIRVVVPEAAFPMAIAIDGGDRMPAFIDRVESDDDGVVVVAAIRCPALRRGQHSATAYTASGAYTAAFEVD